MTKAKAKADRAAARQAAAAAGTSGSTARTASTTTPPAPTEESQPSDAMHVDPHPTLEGEDALPRLEREPASVDRTELLRSNPVVVGRFLRLIVPILVDVYAASVNSPVRVRTLTGLLKAVSFLDGDELKQVFSVCQVNCSAKI